MPTRVRCRCQGNVACILCFGQKFYEYQPGLRGWMPFPCPTCLGAGVLSNSRGEDQPCFTCARAGNVDPANPPYAPGWRGMMRVGWKIFFGGG